MYSLVGVNGNAYVIMGYTRRAMKNEGFEENDIEQMMADATSGDYDNLIRVCSSWIDAVNEKVGEEDD